MKRSLSTNVLTLSALPVVMSLISSARAADTILSSFVPGGIVVMRGGDATNPQATAGEVNAYLDEYTTAGTYVGTIPVNSNFTLPSYGQGGVSHEGGLNVSSDGHYLSYGGYTTAAGATARPVDGSATDAIGVIGTTASSQNTTTTISPSTATGQYIHAVYSTDGSHFYVAGKGLNTGVSPDSGLQYVNGVGPAATVTNLEAGTDWRNVIVANNTLYGGTGSSSTGPNHAGGVHGVDLIGAQGTAPTGTLSSTNSDNHLLTNYSGGNSASNLSLLSIATTDANAKTQNGFDVLYTIGDQGSAGITKYYFDGTTWQRTSVQVNLNATNVANPTGLIAQVDPSNPSNVDLFVSGQNGIYSYVDTTGDPTTALASNAFSLIAAPRDANSAFYGLAPAPVPEPATIGMLMLGGVATGLRRRRA